MKKNKKKVIYKEDDGRTIYDMSGVSGNPNTSNAKKNDNQSGVYLTKKERRAVIIAGFKHYVPIFLMGLAGFTIAILLMYLWLS